MRRRFTLVGALLIAGGLATVAPAAADPSPHCQEGGYCLFSSTYFSGAKAVLPSGYGCRPVSDLGFGTARSAARGYGDGAALELYADTHCVTSVGTVYYEVPETSAQSYRLVPIPS